MKKLAVGIDPGIFNSGWGVVERSLRVHVYSWHGLEKIIDTVAHHYGCSVSDVRSVMRRIEQKYPKQKTWRNIEFRKPCRTCKQTIGFARTDAGKLMPVNLHDFTTHWGCEKPGKPKKKGR